MSAPAYFFHGMTFCNRCALGSTRAAWALLGVQPPATMEDAIADLLLGQVANGNEVDVPVAVSAPGTCDNCHEAFGTPAPVEDGAA